VFRKKEKHYGHIDPNSRRAEEQYVIESFHWLENQLIVFAN
jgi:hypothetical protein